MIGAAFKKKLKSLRPAGDIARELREAVEELRLQRLRLLDQRDDVAGRPWPKDEVHAAIGRGLADIAERAKRDFYTPPLLRGERGPAFGSPSLEVLVGILIEANRGAVEAVLRGLVAPHFEGAAPLSAAEREAEIARLNEGLADLERAEESAIREAERAGMTIARRDDADPDALLMSDAALGLAP